MFYCQGILQFFCVCVTWMESVISVFSFCDCSFHSPSPGIYLRELIHLNEIMQRGGVAQKRGESGKKIT